LLIKFKSGWFMPLARKIQFDDAAEAKAALGELK
jgi:hypothetical protein